MTQYGFFPGGDPRKFTPDPECSTEEERERHRKDCELATLQGTEQPGAGSLEYIPAGTIKHKDGTTNAGGMAFVTRARYGLGTYEYPDDAAEPQTSA